MLLIDHPARDIPKIEYFNNATQEFVTIEARHIDPIHLQLEHSLMSIARWEAKWHKPFLGKDSFDPDELKDYIRCMTINPQKNPAVYDDLMQEDVTRIVGYMQDENSAWTISPRKKGKKVKKAEPVESIYYAMIQFGVPMECEKWHFNRLMALLDYCDTKGVGVPGGGSPEKRSQREIMEMYRAMNERNRKKYNSKG